MMSHGIDIVAKRFQRSNLIIYHFVSITPFNINDFIENPFSKLSLYFHYDFYWPYSTSMIREMSVKNLSSSCNCRSHGPIKFKDFSST